MNRSAKFQLPLVKLFSEKEKPQKITNINEKN